MANVKKSCMTCAAHHVVEGALGLNMFRLKTLDSFAVCVIVKLSMTLYALKLAKLKNGEK